MKNEAGCETFSKLVLESAASLENAQEICSISLTPCFSGVWAKNEVLSTVSTVYNPITECVRSRNVKKTVENGSGGQSVRVTQLKLGVNESSHASRRKLLRQSLEVVPTNVGEDAVQKLRCALMKGIPVAVLEIE